MILPLEQMVTSKGLSERLKKFGVPQDSCFYWRRGDVRKTYKWEISNRKMRSIGGTFSAYLESEIGVLLPGIIWDKKGKQRMLVMLKKDEKYYVGYECSTYDRCREKNHIMVSFEENTRIEAMGLILEYLLVNGLIKL